MGEIPTARRISGVTGWGNTVCHRCGASGAGAGAEVGDCWAEATAVTAFVAIAAAMYPLARTDVEVGPSDLILRWRIFGFVPFGRRTIPIARVLEVRSWSHRDWKLPIQFFGGALRPGRRHLAVVIRPRWFGRPYGIVLAPSDAAEVERALGERLANSDREKS